ncbi:MAG: hypothetical protein WBQ76_11725 [Candidatus Korobacteraceae bacterium]
MTPVAACPLCTHLTKGMKCTAYPDGIPSDIQAGKDYHFEIRKDQTGTDVFTPTPGVKLPEWLKPAKAMNDRWKQPPPVVEHKAPSGQFHAVGCDTFEGPMADYLIGDYDTLDAAIEAAKAGLSPMVSVYVYDETGQCRFHDYMPSQ